MSVETIQIVGTAVIETDNDGKQNIVLTINNNDCLFNNDNTSLSVVLNSIVLGSWR